MYVMFYACLAFLSRDYGPERRGGKGKRKKKKENGRSLRRKTFQPTAGEETKKGEQKLMGAVK
jgi:hypothetical protein